MAGLSDVEASFSALGGIFVRPAPELAARARALRGLLFDWDGVFNSGTKGEGVSSTFNEADSMGLNLLRFALWRRAEELPFVALITGEDNPGARRFAKREHLHVVYTGIRDKAAAVDDACSSFGVAAEHLACTFDDVNDLAMAAKCGLRVLVRRDSSPLLREYVVGRGLCDYVTGAQSGDHAVREVMELLLGLLGCFDDVVASRTACDDRYTRYFAARQALELRCTAGVPATDPRGAGARSVSA